jgi:hypothetical protein
LLTLGDFDGGWAEYEWRFGIEGLVNSRSTYSQPHWDGAVPLVGKTILLYTEQGLGDSIMFVRYAPMLASQGASVIVGVLPAVKRLMSEIGGVTILAPGDPLPSFDLQCPLLSLPYLLNTRVETIPANVPYLQPRSDWVDAWRDRIPRNKRLRIGVVWAGGRDFASDATRSILLRQFETLFDVPDVTFISLQRELRDGDAERLLRWSDVVHFGDKLDDFADTAAVI